ncbi:hypothetical protein C0995_006756, partial [Termitomyces sp. Mi166
FSQSCCYKSRKKFVPFQVPCRQHRNVLPNGQCLKIKVKAKVKRQKMTTMMMRLPKSLGRSWKILWCQQHLTINYWQVYCRHHQSISKGIVGCLEAQRFWVG